MIAAKLLGSTFRIAIHPLARIEQFLNIAAHVTHPHLPA